MFKKIYNPWQCGGYHIKNNDGSIIFAYEPCLEDVRARIEKLRFYTFCLETNTWETVIKSDKKYKSYYNLYKKYG